jgi:hypothetical protein
MATAQLKFRCIRLLDQDMFKVEGRRLFSEESSVAYRVSAARVDRYRVLPDLHENMFQETAQGVWMQRKDTRYPCKHHFPDDLGQFEIDHRISSKIVVGEIIKRLPLPYRLKAVSAC